MGQTVTWLFSAVFFGAVAFASVFLLIEATNIAPWAMFVSGIVGVIAAVGVYMSLIWASDRQVMKQRLSEMTETVGHGEERQRKPEDRAKKEPKIDLTNVASMSRQALFLGDKNIRETRLLLIRSGFYREDALVIYLVIKLVIPVALMLTMGFLASQSGKELENVILFSIGGLLGGLVGVDRVLNSIAKKRRAKIADDLPDALDLIVIYSETGASFDTAVARVQAGMKKAAPELAQEFSILSQEIALLPSRTQAYENLKERLKIPFLSSLVTVLRQSEQFGTPISEGLKQLADEIRRERMLEAERKAARIPVLITMPLIIMILPALLLIIVGPAALSVVDRIINR